MLYDRKLPPEDVLNGIAAIMSEAIAALERSRIVVGRMTYTTDIVKLNRLLFVELAETASHNLSEALRRALDEAPPPPTMKPNPPLGSLPTYEEWSGREPPVEAPGGSGG